MGGGPFLWPGPNSPLPLWGGGYPMLRSAKIVTIGPIALSSGENDIYTVPTGKRASISFSLVNISGSNVNQTVQLKNGGNYYQLLPLAAVTGTGTGSTTIISNAFNTLPILEEGESFAILMSATGVTLFGFVIVFDNTEPLKSPKLLTLASGNNTLYTCPAGKVAFNGSLLGGNAGQIQVFNGSNGTRTYSVNAVPAGGSVATSNQISAGTATAATLTTFANANTYASIAATGFYSVNTDNSAAGQVAWIRNLIELPA